MRLTQALVTAYLQETRIGQVCLATQPIVNCLIHVGEGHEREYKFLAGKNS